MHTSLTRTAKMGYVAFLVVGFCLETWKWLKCQSSTAPCARSLGKQKAKQKTVLLPESRYGLLHFHGLSSV